VNAVIKKQKKNRKVRTTQRQHIHIQVEIKTSKLIMAEVDVLTAVANNISITGT
jgi:hypothetical protein